LIYSFSKIEEKIIFKLYDGNIYYQFVFIFSNIDGDKKLNIIIKERIVICYIFVENLKFEIETEIINGNNFYKFLKILKDGDISYFSSFL